MALTNRPAAWPPLSPRVGSTPRLRLSKQDRARRIRNGDRGKERTGARADPLRHGRRRAGRLHRRRPQDCRAHGRRVPAGRRRAVVGSGARQGVGGRARPRSRAQLRHLCRDGQGRSQAQGRHRGGRNRYAEPHAFRSRQGLPRSGHPRHLRQAADLVAGRCQEARGDRRKVRQAVRADPQLHRLSDDPAGSRHGRRRACSATSVSCSPNTRRTG